MVSLVDHSSGSLFEGTRFACTRATFQETDAIILLRIQASSLRHNKTNQ